METDKLRYKLTVDGNDITTDVLNAKARRFIKEYPQFQVDVRNDGGIYTTNSSFSNGKTVVMSASKDNGDNYIRIFNGEITEVATEYENSGRDTFIIKCSGATPFRSYYLSPCQITQGPGNLGSFFTGSPTDRNTVSWTKDSDGNYPNGILYKSGYSLSADSDTDIITDFEDIPYKIQFTNKTLLDATNFVSEVFATTFLFNDVAGTVAVYKDPVYTNFPTYSYTLSEERDISRLRLAENSREQYDRIILIGADPDLYAIIGSGVREYHYDDTQIRDPVTLLNKAAQQYRKRSLIKPRLEILCPPVTEDILGKRITIDESEHGISNYGNVVGVEHNLTPDHWESTIYLEGIDPTEGLLFTEIQRKIKEISTEAGSLGDVYLYGVATKSSAVSGIVTALMGFGTSSVTTAACSLSKGVLLKKPTNIVLDTTSGIQYVYSKIPAGDMKFRMREMNVIKCTNQPNSTLNVQLKENGTKSGSYTLLTNSIATSSVEKYPNAVGLDVANDQSFSYYWYKPIMANIQRLSTTNIKTSALPTIEGLENLSADYVWTGSTNSSVDIGNDNPVGSGATTSYLYMAFSTNLPTVSADYFEDMVIHRRHYTTTGSGGDYSEVELYFWNVSASLWELRDGPFTNSAETFSTLSYSSERTNEWVDDKGVFRVLIRQQPHLYTGGTYHLNYFDLYFKIKSYMEKWSGVRRLEKATYDATNQTIYLSYPIGVTYGIFLSESGGLPVESTRIWSAYEGQVPADMEFPNAPADLRCLPLNRLGLSCAKFATDPPRTIPLEIDGWGWVGEYTTEGNYRYISDILRENGYVYVDYETVYRSAMYSLPSAPIVNASSSRIMYSNAMDTASLYYDLADPHGPAYDVPIRVSYYQAREPYARFVVQSNSRIDQGIPLDGTKNIHIMLAIKTSSGASGTGSIDGQGCAVP
jgi:hypothetical protein